MISQFFVLSPRGDTIITREFRADVAGSAEIFFRKVKFWKGDPEPFFIVDGVSYCFVKRSGLYYVCTTRHNISPSFTIELLNQIVTVFKDYCGVLNEEGMRRNYVLIYELLDEIIDGGYAQNISSESLRSFVFNEATVQANPISSVIKRFGILDINPKTTSSTSVLKPIAGASDKANRKNEVFVDIAEKISALFNANGQVLNSEIQGSVQMKSYLTGNPELQLTLNPDLVIGKGNGYGVVLDDCNFHECVKIENFERDKVLILNPPDGEFIAMNYRVTSFLNPPFRLYPVITEQGPQKIEIFLRLKSEIAEAHYGCNMCISFPVPKTASNVVFETSEGATGQRTSYKNKAQTCEWLIKKLTGNAEVTLSVRVTLSSPSTPITKKEIGPFRIDFEIPMYNVSGLNVKYLEIVSQSKQKQFRWVRYVTYSKSYVVRP